MRYFVCLAMIIICGCNPPTEDIPLIAGSEPDLEVAEVVEDHETNDPKDEEQIETDLNIVDPEVADHPDVDLNSTTIDLAARKKTFLSTIDTAGDRLEKTCLLYTSPSPRDQRGSRMPSSA